MIIFTILWLLFVVAAVFFYQGLRRIPAEPPHMGIRTIWGRRQSGAETEGWHFYPLYPWWHGVILVNMTEKNQDLVPQDVRTSGDMADIEIQVSLTWAPDPDRLIKYRNSGGEAGVSDILEDIVTDAVRGFAADPTRMPNTWEEAVKMQREFLFEIVEAILERTGVAFSNIETVATELKRGNGKLHLEYLGIILIRVNVTRVQPKGKLAEAAEREAVEKRERLAEIVELTHFRERIAELIKAPPDGPGLSPEQAIEVFQTERGKVSKTIEEKKFSVPAETRKMLLEIAREIAKSFGKGEKT